MEDELQRDAAKKEKHRLKLQKLLAEKVERDDTVPAVLTSVDDTARAGNGAPAATKPHPRSAQPLTSHSRQAAAHGNASGTDNELEAGEGKSAVGSGLAAIRRRARSLSQSAADGGAEGGEDNLLAQQRLLQKQQKEEEEAIEEALKEQMQKELRKVASKEQANKLSNYLNNIAEQRKKDEAEKKKADERAKKRMLLLSARLLQEASERKLMQQHDDGKYSNQTDSAPVAAPKAPRVKIAASESAPVVHKPRPPVVPAPITTSGAPARNEGVAANESTKAPKKVKITQEMADKMAQRLTAQAPKDTEDGKDSYSAVPARDFADWKRKNGVPADAMVFAMTGWYPCVKEALIARGWHYNPDPASSFFHLKWTLRSNDIQEALQPWQLTNHYLKNVAITTKAGLIKSLSQLVWTADVEANDIIPRGYDLSNNLEMQAFLDDFRTQKAESILKALYLQLTGLDLPAMRAPPPLASPRPDSPDSEKSDPSAADDATVAEATDKSLSPKPKQKISEKIAKTASLTESIDATDDSDEPNFPPVPPLAAGIVLENIKVNVAVFEAILSVLEKQIKPYEDSYIDDREAHTEKLISDLE